MTGTKIIASAEPKGVFKEGFLASGQTPKPGVVMMKSAATEPVNGRYEWTVYAPGTDGNRRLVAVLLEDELQGRTYDDAYEAGSTCYLYVPVMGEKLNMRYQDVAGTGDSKAIGDMQIVDSGTGKLIATTGTPESEPFECIETSTNPVADTLLLSEYTGY